MFVNVCVCVCGILACTYNDIHSVKFLVLQLVNYYICAFMSRENVIVTVMGVSDV